VEFLPSSHRGRFLMYMHAFWTLGAILVSMLAWLLLPYYGWRSLLFVTALPVALAAVLGYCWLPESPRWLVRKGRLARAREVVAAAALLNDTPMPDKCTVAPREATADTSGAEEGVLLLEFFRSTEVWVTAPIITCWFCFGFCYFSVVLFVIKVFERHPGDDDHFEGVGECDFDYGAIFLSAASELLGLLVASIVIDRWGRISTQMATFLCAAAGSFLLSLDVSEVQLLLISMLARMSIIGANSSVATGTPELFQTKYRATGHAVVNCAARLGSFLSPYLVEARTLSNTTVGVTIAVVNLVGMCAAFCLPETKGLALDTVKTLSLSQATLRPSCLCM
jgi:MFS family permease